MTGCCSLLLHCSAASCRGGSVRFSFIAFAATAAIGRPPLRLSEAGHILPQEQWLPGVVPPYRDDAEWLLFSFAALLLLRAVRALAPSVCLCSRATCFLWRLVVARGGSSCPARASLLRALW